MRSLVLCVAILALSSYVHSARILGLFPHTGKSHQMVFEPLLRKLAERGHHVTVASFFPLKNPPANYTDVSFEGIATLGLESFDLNWYENPDFILRVPVIGRVMKQLAEFHPLAGMALGVCSKAVDWPPLTEALEKDYDVVFVENFNSDCMLGLLHGHGINAPVIALLSSGLMPWSGNRIGVTDNPAYVPVISSDSNPRMTYWQRVENTFLSLYHKLWFRYLIQVKEQEILEKRFGRKIPDLEDLGRNISLMMLNTHHALNGPTPLVPGLIQVGGMHLDPTRKVIPQVTNYANCGRILALIPQIGKSHNMVFEPLFRKLAERGHDVTVASFFPLENPPANYRDISFEGIAPLGVEAIDIIWHERIGIILRMPIIGRVVMHLTKFNALGRIALKVCKKAVDWPPLTEALQKDYDVIFVENFNSDCMLGLIHVYGINAPVIALLSSNLMPWSAYRVGVSDNPSYVPMYSTGFNSRMTFWERMENTFCNVYHKLWFHYRIQVKEQEIIEQHFGRKIPDLDDIGRNISLMMLNTYHVLNGRGPLVPGLIQIGGIHLDIPRNVVPEYIEKFLNESEHGVVLFSFGSLIRTATMPKYKEDIIVNSLSKLKQRVIWKYEDSAEQGNLTGNILRVRWLPQYELLQHNKIHAFIAHGGLLGMTEAVSAGKPMVVVPFFGDQPANGAAAAAAGLAKVVPYYDLTEEALDDAIQSVLSAEMRMNARRISKMWKDRESSPLDTAVFWTERVIRWGHAAPLHTAARELAFYELALLDVAAAYILALVIIHIILWFLLSKIVQLFVREPKQKLH